MFSRHKKDSAGGKLSKREDEIVGTVLDGRYRITEIIAHGGMGTVYKAEQLPLGRVVAVKVLRLPKRAESARTFRERFSFEAATLGAATHPNTVALYDFGTVDDQILYFAMEHIEGLTLADFIKLRGPLPEWASVHIARQVCASLEEAHGQGVVHRDLKPSNIMLTQRGSDRLFVKVLDFGLARAVERDAEDIDLTHRGMLLGTPRYMAPEQIRGLTVDARTDVYALGAVLHHAVTGHPPFIADSPFDVLRAHIENDVPPLRERHPDASVSPRLERLIMQCLRKDPKDRPATMGEVAQAVEACAPPAPDLGLRSGSSGPLCVFPLSPRRDDAMAASASLSAASAGSDDSTAPTVCGRGGRGKRGYVSARASQPVLGPVRSGFQKATKRGVLLASSTAIGALCAAAFGSFPGDLVAAASIDERRGAGTGRREAKRPTRVVRVESHPAGARVMRGDEDLGDTPISLVVAEHDRFPLTIEAPGHEARTVTLSRHQHRLSVRLSRQEASAPSAAVPDRPPSGAARTQLAAVASRYRGGKKPRDRRRRADSPSPGGPDPAQTQPESLLFGGDGRKSSTLGPPALLPSSLPPAALPPQGFPSAAAPGSGGPPWAPSARTDNLDPWALTEPG